MLSEIALSTFRIPVFPVQPDPFRLPAMVSVTPQ